MRYLLLSAALLLATVAVATAGAVVVKLFDCPASCNCGCQQTGVCDCGE